MFTEIPGPTRRMSLPRYDDEEFDDLYGSAEDEDVNIMNGIGDRDSKLQVPSAGIELDKTPPSLAQDTNLLYMENHVPVDPPLIPRTASSSSGLMLTTNPHLLTAFMLLIAMSKSF